MLETHLFFGFPLDDFYVKKLKGIDSNLKSIFVQEGGDYLQEVLLKDQPYLGKYVSNGVDLPALEQLEKNIYSLLKKLIPDYPYENVPLHLISIIK